MLSASLCLDRPSCSNYTEQKRGKRKSICLPCTFCVPRYPRVTRMRGSVAGTG